MSTSNGFSENAHLYATSLAHSETEDLELAAQILGDLDGQDVLDVATGTGHTAFFFADAGAHVFGVDINDEMLAVAQEESDRKTLACRFLKGFASDLPFDDNSFDIVTTRLAAHHFASPGDFLAEARRVLRPQGQLLIIDNVVPEAEAGAWINDYEKQRDPSHQACLTKEQWTQSLREHGFPEMSFQDFPKSLDYDSWMQRMSVAEDQATALWEKLLAAPQNVTEFLQPQANQEKRSLTLHRLIAVAKG